MIANLVQKALGRMGLRLIRAPVIRGGRRGANTGGYIGGLPDWLACEAIVDVGVAGGTPWLYDRFPDARLLLVEPLNVVDSLPAVLAGRDYTFFECAAGSQRGEATINYNPARPALSSIKERSALTETGDRLEAKTVPVRTIDDIVAEAGLAGKKIGIKVDTEGFELEAMKGAVETLRHCAFVICEASVAQRFEDSYDFSELVSFMDRQGFFVSRFINFWVDGTGYLRMADLLFEPRKG